MGFANNVLPSYMLEALIDRTMYTAFTTYTTTANTKESNMYKSIDITHQTELNRKQAADEAKRAAKGRKSSVQVETHLYGDEPFSTITIQNDAGQRDDDTYNPRYMSVRLSADDLEKLQDAVYATRVELAKHTTNIKNPKVNISAW
jgi:hypothetical protein